MKTQCVALLGLIANAQVMPMLELGGKCQLFSITTLTTLSHVEAKRDVCRFIP